MNFIPPQEALKQIITIENYLSETSIDAQRQEIIQGLSADKKHISSKYFYDKKGSELFEEITTLPEYYPTRTEKSILTEKAKEITKNLQHSAIIELGSGDNSKISILLNAMSSAQLNSVVYFPFDVSKTAIEKSAKNLSETFPDLKIQGIAADFTHQLNRIPKSKNKMICFFGSTVGNLERQEAQTFIKNIGNIMTPDDVFILGVDMVKDIRTLEDAYNDKSGITAAFNKNILSVVNGIVKTDFNPELFEHIAFYNKDKARIEMHLRAVKDMKIRSSEYNFEMTLKKDEYIHTENSHKFTKEDIYEFADFSGLSVKNIFTDNNYFFSLAEFIK